MIDISGAYDTRRKGTYTVRYNAVQQILQGTLPSALTAAGAPSPEVNSQYVGRGVSSPSIAITISGTPESKSDADPLLKPDVERDPVSADQFEWPTATYGCQSPSVITSAQSTARSRAQRAYNAATSFNSWYQTWFGNSPSSVSTVRSRFSNAYNRLGQNVDYYCGSYAPYCSAGVVAYTYKTTSNRVYLCTAFWSYSNKGTSSATRRITGTPSPARTTSPTVPASARAWRDRGRTMPSAMQITMRMRPTPRLRGGCRHKYTAG